MEWLGEIGIASLSQIPCYKTELFELCNPEALLFVLIWILFLLVFFFFTLSSFFGGWGFQLDGRLPEDMVCLISTCFSWPDRGFCPWFEVVRFHFISLK